MSSIDTVVRTALRDDFGPDFDLSEALLCEIEDSILSALIVHNYGHDVTGNRYDDVSEALRPEAERLAQRYDGTQTEA